MQKPFLFKLAPVALMSLFVSAAHAELDLRIMGPALSYHEARADLKGREYNEVHPGLGVELRKAQENPSLYSFGSLVVMKDSFDSPAAFASGGVRYQLLGPTAPVDLSVGAMGGVAYKRLAWCKPRELTPIGGVQLALEHKATGLGLVLSWAPRSTRPQDHKSRDIWTLQTSWRLP